MTNNLKLATNIAAMKPVYVLAGEGSHSHWYSLKPAHHNLYENIFKTSMEVFNQNLNENYTDSDSFCVIWTRSINFAWKLSKFGYC